MILELILEFIFSPFIFWIPSLLLKEVGTSLGTHVIINKVQTNKTISNIWNNILFYFVAGRTFTLIMLYVEAMDFWDEPLNCVPATKSTQNVTSVYILKLKCHRKLQKSFYIKDWPSTIVGPIQTGWPSIETRLETRVDTF